MPTFSWITPNQCHIFYWKSVCSTPDSDKIKEGDKFLAILIPKLTATPSYQAGKTLIIITWDEGLEAVNVNGVDCSDPYYYVNHPDCHVPTVVVSPYITPGSTDNADHNLYGLLGTVQDILGVERLGRAVGEQSMRSGLGF